MKIQLFSLVFILSVVSCLALSEGSYKWRGEKEGGGGSAVVCRTSSGAIKSVHVLDIWEQQEEFHLNKTKFTGTPEEFAKSLIGRLRLADKEYFEIFESLISEMLKKMKAIGPNSKLELVYDTYPVLKPKECSIEQLALYQYELGGHLLYDGELWDHMDGFNRAALYVHEAVFKILREKEFVLNSRKARKIVAFVMSELTDIDFSEVYHQEIKNMNNSGKIKDLLIYETVRGKAVFIKGGDKMTALRQAEESFRAACENWKEKSAREMRVPVVMQDCGEPEPQAIEDDVIGENGKKTKVLLGYEYFSNARLLGKIDESHDVKMLDRIQIRSASIEHRHTVLDSSEAYLKAGEDLSNECEKRKAYTREQFKTGFIYFVCDDPGHPKRIVREKE